MAVLNDVPKVGELDIPTNTRTGFDVQIATWIGDNTSPGYITNLKGVTVDQRVPEIRDRGVDFVYAALSITPEKTQQIGIAGPYLLTRQGVLLQRGAKPVGREEDLNGLTVCTVQGSTSEVQLRALESQGKIRLTPEKGNSGCFDRMKKGEVQAFSTDQFILQAFALSAGSEGRFEVSPYTFGNAEEYGIGYRLGHLDQCAMLTEGIKKYIKDGIWDNNFRNDFPGLDPRPYRPDPDALNAC